ncbi:MAG: glycine cleavage system protein GcvH [Candidatus Sericytochromatia bacterium]|nr:glycine cleavage system protein GcvH [Candidatus Sericytochromatia bacterium]
MSTTFPLDLHYLSSHEYARLSDGEATIGITAFAVEQLGDVVFVDLPEVGRTVRKGDVFGAIESVKAVSDLYSPLSGTVTAINAGLEANPDLINAAPYEKGWLIKLTPTQVSEYDELLDASAYQATVEESEG